MQNTFYTFFRVLSAMNKYLILQNPGHNRVYYSKSVNMALAELELSCLQFDMKCSNVQVAEIAGVRYLQFESEKEIAQKEIVLISRLSYFFALFESKGEGDDLALLPISRADFGYVDDKISSILKYPGKTNEIFTRMMINVAAMSSDFDATEPLNMLDPVSGKGTTLFEGLIYGYDVYGIEIEQKQVHEASVFFKKYLENERYKHDFEKRPIAGTHKSDMIYISEYEFARNKEEFKDAGSRKTFALVQGKTEDADQYFKKNSFDLIVGDLPYGISHGNRTGKKNLSATRNPSELLTLALPAWFNILRKGGALVVAWNSFIVKREVLAALFEANGFEVLMDSPYDKFEHMVDKSIKRDIIVAKKPK